MARARRPWAELRAEVKRLLGPVGDDPFWTRELLADLFNAEKDLREMQLEDVHEGFSVRAFVTDLVVPPTGQPAAYLIPLHAGRFKRVLRRFQDGSEVPLERNEQLQGGSTLGYLGGDLSYVPSYRLMGAYLVLDPPPGVPESGGLKIEMEECSSRIESDGDYLPAGWPLILETLLVLDTAGAAFDVEAAQDVVSQVRDKVMTPLVGRQRRMEATFLQWIETRSAGVQSVEPFCLGG